MIKLSRAQLETLRKIANPEYKSRRYGYLVGHSNHLHYRITTLRILRKHGLITTKDGAYGDPMHVFLSDLGRDYLAQNPE